MPILIDGHNLIGKMSSISLADPRDEDKLVEMLKRYLLHRQQKAIVVFDKGSDSYPAPSRGNSDLSIIFAPPESCADAIIIDMIKQDPNPKGLTIVSSDNEIRRCAKSRRARLVSAENFAEQLESKPKRSGKNRAMNDRVDDIDVAEWSDYFEKGRK
jgi:predicted RNA-binding protein with PIN domain